MHGLLGEEDSGKCLFDSPLGTLYKIYTKLKESSTDQDVETLIKKVLFKLLDNGKC